jgi:hypothetical protein
MLLCFERNGKFEGICCGAFGCLGEEEEIEGGQD